MQNPPKVKLGDRVKVTVEGTAEAPDEKGGFVVRSDPCQVGVYVSPSRDVVTSIEVVKSPMKKGDVIKDDDYDDVPVGTVVASSETSERPAFVRGKDLWVELRFPRRSAPVELSSPRVVLFVPSVG